MIIKKTYSILFLLAIVLSSCKKQEPKKEYDTNRIISYEVNPKKDDIQFYWKNEAGKPYGSIQNLKTELQAKQQKLIFAMNGGMYFKDQSPQGLYIENGIIKSLLDSKEKGYGNFYLQPNGVFYITKENNPVIGTTKAFKNAANIKYATQSGPMLVVEGEIHHKFTKGSKNVHIRNGVGVLPNGKLLFAISKEKINLYDFATFFKTHGCKNALYLDGFVSRAYIPSKKWEQLDGKFGVIIGVTKRN